MLPWALTERAEWKYFISFWMYFKSLLAFHMCGICMCVCVCVCVCNAGVTFGKLNVVWTCCVSGGSLTSISACVRVCASWAVAPRADGFKMTKLMFCVCNTVTKPKGLSETRKKKKLKNERVAIKLRPNVEVFYPEEGFIPPWPEVK